MKVILIFGFSKRILLGENGPFDQVLTNGSGGSSDNLFLLYFTAGLKCPLLLYFTELFVFMENKMKLTFFYVYNYANN